MENELVLRGAANAARWVVRGVSRDSTFWLLILCMVVAWYVPSSGQVIIQDSRAPIVPHFDESRSEYAFLVRAGAFPVISVPDGLPSNTRFNHLVDCGASRHMCNDAKYFCNLLQYEATISVAKDDPEPMLATGIGNVILRSQNASGCVCTIR